MYWKKPNQSDREFLELTPDVKKVMQIVYKAHHIGDELIQDKIRVDHGSDETNFILTFHENGNKKELVTYSSISRTISRYYDNGAAQETIQFTGGKLYQTMKYYYNDLGQRIGSEAFNNKGGIRYKLEHTYTDTKQPLETINYESKGGELVVRRKDVYTYRDEIEIVNGIPRRQYISHIVYKGDGSLENSTIRKFDELGQCIESVDKYTDPEAKDFNRKFTHKYNEHGDEIEYKVFDLNGVLKESHVFTYEYDSEGKRINIHMGKTHDEKDPLETETFETDSRGNWIRKTTYYNKIPDKIYTRELVYEGEEKELEHPLSDARVLKEETVEAPIEKYDLDEAEVKWLVEPANASPENFSFLRFYTLQFNSIPSVITYQGPNIEAIYLLEKLKKYVGAHVIHTYTSEDASGKERLHRYTVVLYCYWGYMLSATNISSQNKDEFIIPAGKDKADDNNVYTSQIQLLCPGNATGKRDEYTESSMLNMIRECTLRKKPDKPFINVIEAKAGNYTVTEYAINDDFIINDLDLNYGGGFEEFHNQLMLRFGTTTKGLVLFHGIPGTGKTYYIRHLLRKMVTNRKKVIYIPPSMVAHLVDPAFMTFISAQLKRWGEEGHSCVLLIEDAEPLLAKRQEGGRNQGVTNLLNMTDGLLNDMLNIQIICTFNVGLNKLDSALLRPGRLIARKEFKALPGLDANLLAQRLGIKHHFTKPATLGEIYSMRSNHNILLHEVDTDNEASATIEDFL